MKAIHYLLLLGFSFLFTKAQAQRDSAALSVYLGPTFYQGFSSVASYYNGADNNRLNFLFNEPTTRQRIEQALGGNTFQLVDYARNMRYNTAFGFQLAARYHWNRSWFADFALTNARLQASGTFTLSVNRNDPNNNNQQVIEVATASGEERRNHISLGLGRSIGLGSGWFLEPALAFDLNFVEVASNQVIIADQPFALPVFNNPLNPQADQITTIGNGVGGFLDLVYLLPKHYGFSLRYAWYYSRIDVNQVRQNRGSLHLVNLNFHYRW